MEKDETRLRAILATQPNNAGALAGMAWVRSRQGNYLAAVGYLEQARQQRPGDRALSTALNLDRYRAIVAEADDALSSNNLRSAEKFYTLALEIRPQGREAQAGLRSILRRQQQPVEAAAK